MGESCRFPGEPKRESLSDLELQRAHVTMQYSTGQGGYPALFFQVTSEDFCSPS